MLQAGSQDVLVPGERNAMTEGMKRSVNDYIDAVRTLKEPESNAVEGMMQLAMNTAAMISVQTGSPVKLNKVYDAV